MVPKHIAIIPDGNRRWARKKGLAATQGHAQAGTLDNLRALFTAAVNKGVGHISLWVFSTENWKRPATERKALFSLLSERVDDLKELASKEGLKVRWLGRRDRVPEDIKHSLEEIEAIEPPEVKLNVQLCVDYGGRDELLRAINEAISRGEKQTEDSFSRLLDTVDIPDPDLIIRTSGEQRLSGFLPWQSAYAELFFVDKHFPDFTPRDLLQAIDAFEQRQRRYGV